MARVNVPVTDLAPVKASLTTSLAGSNNDLVFTAKKGGTWGNSIQVAYIDPGGTTATLGVVVSGFLVTVNLGRTSSAIDTTANAIVTAIARAADAAALVDVTNASSNDGTGIVTALTATSLAGGTYAVALPAVTNGDSTNKHYLTGNDGQVMLQVVSSDASSRTVTVKRAPSYGGGVPASDEVVTVAAGVTMEIGPFSPGEFNQNTAKDVYFDPSVSNTLDFRAYRVARVT